MRSRKRSFLLFELLISLALLMVCLLPMIKTHVSLHQAAFEELHALQQMESVQEAFCTYKIDLHEHTVPWEELTKLQVDEVTKKSQEKGIVIAMDFEGQTRTFYVKKAKR